MLKAHWLIFLWVGEGYNYPSFIVRLSFVIRSFGIGGGWGAVEVYFFAQKFVG